MTKLEPGRSAPLCSIVKIHPLARGALSPKNLAGRHDLIIISSCLWRKCRDEWRPQIRQRHGGDQRGIAEQRACAQDKSNARAVSLGISCLHDGVRRDAEL